MWVPSQLVDAAATALRLRTEELLLEQSVRGLDSLEEVQFHPVLAAGFVAAGLGVHREVPYPGEPARRLRHAERERCDLVLTLSADTPLRDPVAELKERDAAEDTLFASLAGSPDLCVSPGVGPDEAYWLEVKLIGQHCYSAGIPGPNRTYASELLTTAARDIPKLAVDERITHAGLLLLLFTEDRDTADHDLAAFMHRCLDRSLPVTTPSMERFAIPDIIGNRLCTVCLAPVSPVRAAGIEG